MQESLFIFDSVQLRGAEQAAVVTPSRSPTLQGIPDRYEGVLCRENSREEPTAAARGAEQAASVWDRYKMMLMPKLRLVHSVQRAALWHLAAAKLTTPSANPAEPPQVSRLSQSTQSSDLSTQFRNTVPPSVQQSARTQ